MGQDKIPNNIRANGGVTDLKRLKGLVTNAALVPGEQLLASRFDTPEVAGQGDVPKGLLAGDRQARSGAGPRRRGEAGDNVGVLMSFGKRSRPACRRSSSSSSARRNRDATHLQLHKVLVTSVQIADDKRRARIRPTTEPRTPRRTEWRNAAPTASLLVTLAARRAVGREGRVCLGVRNRLALRTSPTDAPEGGTQIVTPGNVYGGTAVPQ